MDTWILEMVRARSLRRVTAWAAALACLALLASGQSRYIQNFLMGPYDLGPADLDSIRDVSKTPRYFARVSGSKAIDTILSPLQEPARFERRRQAQDGALVEPGLCGDLRQGQLRSVICERPQDAERALDRLHAVFFHAIL